MATLPIRIVLADDHALIMEGLRSLIDRQPDMRVMAAVQDGAEGFALKHDPLPAQKHLRETRRDQSY